MVKHKKSHGFTLIELLIVMTVIAVLLSIVYPKYFKSVDRSKEAALHEDLSIMRDALDKYYSDTGTLPLSLDDLVSKGYIREVPIDPITGVATSWVLLPPPEGSQTGIFNIKSGAKGKAGDGSFYVTW